MLQNHKRLQIGIALLLPVLMASLIYAIFVAPYLAYKQELQNEVERAANIQQRVKQEVARLPSLQNQMRQLRTNRNFNQYFHATGTASVVSAKIQQQIGMIIRNQGGQTVSTQTQTSTQTGALIKLNIVSQIRADYKQITNILRELSNARPILFIESFKLHTTAARIDIAQKQTNETIDATINVYAYQLPQDANNKESNI